MRMRCGTTDIDNIFEKEYAGVDLCVMQREPVHKEMKQRDAAALLSNCVLLGMHPRTRVVWFEMQLGCPSHCAQIPWVTVKRLLV